MDRIAFDRFDQTFIVHSCVVGKMALTTSRTLYEPRATLHNTVLWEENCCSSVCAPAAVSLMSRAGGVGTGLSMPPPLRALTSAMANTKHADLTARHLSAQSLFFPPHVT